MAYATLAQLKAALKITSSTDDTFLTDTLARVTAFIDTKTKRTWQATVAITNEKHDLQINALDDIVIFTRHQDLVSVEAVKIGLTLGGSTPQTLSANDYSFEKEGRIVVYGQIFQTAANLTRNAFDVDRNFISVDYTYGSATPPKDIELACIDIASAVYINRANKGVAMEMIGDYRIQFDKLQNLSEDTLGILQMYRTRRV